jgi:hypothetical protein
VPSEGQGMKKPKLRLVKSQTAQGGLANKGSVVQLVRRPKIVTTKP